jgi:hypothetical protein
LFRLKKFETFPARKGFASLPEEELLVVPTVPGQKP